MYDKTAIELAKTKEVEAKLKEDFERSQFDLEMCRERFDKCQVRLVYQTKLHFCQTFCWNKYLARVPHTIVVQRYFRFSTGHCCCIESWESCDLFPPLYCLAMTHHPSWDWLIDWYADGQLIGITHISFANAITQSKCLAWFDRCNNCRLSWGKFQQKRKRLRYDDVFPDSSMSTAIGHISETKDGAFVKLGQRVSPRPQHSITGTFGWH